MIKTYVCRCLAVLILMGISSLLFADTQLDKEGYPMAVPGYDFEFPRDHGSHPDFKIEWWYLVGHLFDDAGNRYGFQATFFRNRLKPPATNFQGGSKAQNAFGNEQLYLAHMAFVDEAKKRYIFEKRVNRDGWDAFSAEDTLDIQNGNWSLKLTHDEEGKEHFHLSASIRGDLKMELSFHPTKARTLFGEEGGVSIKGDEIGATSYYISYTRLATEGTLIFDERRLSVEGTSWMDHEISSNQLGGELVGWDWTCIQLFDGREIKAYRLRNSKGESSKHSRLIWISKDGTLSYQKPSEYTWSINKYWKSRKTPGDYPTHISLTAIDPVSNQVNKFMLTPVVENQEIVDSSESINYWEGACRVTDEAGQEIGYAYLELTGYDKSLEIK